MDNSNDNHMSATLNSLVSQSTTIDVRPTVEDLGRVRRVSGGIAFLEGLARVTVDEVIAFDDGVFGQIVDFDRTTAHCVLFSSEHDVRTGSVARHTGRAPSVPFGAALRGRMIDPLGATLDELGPITTTQRCPVERDAPGTLERQPIDEPLFTGIKAIDAITPIGRGQRQLILGDRATGKTSLAIDAIINQRDPEMTCVYVSIGTKGSAVVEVVDELRRAGALERTVVVVAPAEAPASLRYLAPYAGCAIAEQEALRGRHALIVYDDLTRHAESYREISLLLRRPPSREAYPGDIFSIHARLMERAFKLSATLGGGSVTALPIAETQRGNIAGFIPTNLISMTDGQIVLDASLFAEAQLPAIDIGRSVSRVGGHAQPAAMREAAANLRLEIGQYEEVKGFTRFGSILDEGTARQIARGKRLLALLTQRERAVAPLAVQVAAFWAYRSGLLDDLEPELIPELELKLGSSRARIENLDLKLRTASTIDSELAAELRDWITSAKVGIAAPA